MNSRINLKLRLLALTLALFGGVTARAGSISFEGVITSGSATWHGGYSFQGSNFRISGSYGFLARYPEECVFSPCHAPGQYIGFDGAFREPTELHAFDFIGGNFVKDGIMYTCVSDCAGSINLGYGFTLPDPGPFPPEHMVVTTSLGIFADFGGYDLQGDQIYLRARGKGKATITLDHAFLNTYIERSVQYEIFAIPEPATQTLAGLGLLAVVLLRRRAVSAAGRT